MVNKRTVEGAAMINPVLGFKVALVSFDISEFQGESGSSHRDRVGLSQIICGFTVGLCGGYHIGGNFFWI
ncbi:hypothetical protein rerp_38520 [Rhodococcus erythropolis]|nr:hypothetical protein rerp_38520 [Rhodococcus erythropolis]